MAVEAGRKTRGGYRRYSSEEREAALADVPKLGLTGAAKAHGIPDATLSTWVRARRKAPAADRIEGEAVGGFEQAAAVDASPAEVAPGPEQTRGAARSKVAGASPTRKGAPLDSGSAVAKAGRARGRAAKNGATRVPSATAPAVEAASKAATEAPSAAKKARVGPRRVTKGAQPAVKTKAQAKQTDPAPKAGRKKRRAAKSYTPSQKAAILEHAASHSVTEASVKFDVSRFSIYDWQRKVRRAAAGQGDSPTSGPAPQEIEAKRDQEILKEWKKNPGLGPSQIRNQLRRSNIKVAVNTTRRVMEDAGYRPPKVERKPHDERYEAVRPNHIWHLDFVQRYINRASAFTLIVIDDCSRYVVGHGIDDAERADMVIETFEEAVRRHGRPEIVLHDRGAAFWSWRGISRFTALLTEMGIDQIAAEHKEWNGKSEVFNANIQKELFDVHRFYDLAETRRRLATHLAWYNHQRTHHALGGLLVPADRYHGRAEEVLARIEAGAGRELGDGLDLRQRTLELFKVVTQNGVPEVWLMGTKILDLSK